MNGSFRVELRQITASCRSCSSQRSKQRGRIISLYLPVCGQQAAVKNRGEMISDEENTVRSWLLSHRKSNMHFRLWRNAHPVTPNQNGRDSPHLDSDMEILSRSAMMMMQPLCFVWQRRANQTNNLIITRSQNSRCEDRHNEQFTDNYGQRSSLGPQLTDEDLDDTAASPRGVQHQLLSQATRSS